MHSFFDLSSYHIGVVNVNPETLSHSRLLLLYTSVSLQRWAGLVTVAVSLSPALYLIVSKLTLTQKQQLREFLVAAEGCASQDSVRVLHSSENLEGRQQITANPRILQRFIKGMTLSLLLKARKLVVDGSADLCHFFIKLTADGRRTQNVTVNGSDDNLCRRAISFFLTRSVVKVSERLMVASLVHVCFYFLCQGLGTAIAMLSFVPMGGALSVYQLGDFSQSALGYVSRCLGRRIGSILILFRVVVAPQTNVYWMNPKRADEMWSKLSPFEFAMVTTLGVIHPLLYSGFRGGFRSMYLLLQHRKLSKKASLSNTKNRTNGVITVGRMVTPRGLLQDFRRYFINYHFVGMPIFAFVAAAVGWESGRYSLVQHEAGGRYEAVGVTLFFWSLFLYLVSIPELPTRMLKVL